MVVERTDAATTRSRGDRRSLFDRFVQAAYVRVSQAPFFFVCTSMVLAWLVSLPLWADLKEWQTAIHTVASVLTLLLVVLLENAGRRTDEAAQEAQCHRRGGGRADGFRRAQRSASPGRRGTLAQGCRS